MQQLKMSSPMIRQPSRSFEMSSMIQLIFELMTRSIVRLELLKQTSLFIKLTSTKTSPKSRRHQTTSATSWCTQPRQDQSQITTSVVFIRIKMGSNLGDFLDFAAAEVIALAPIPCCRTSWPPNGQNNIKIINSEHRWKKLPDMKVNRAWSSTTILKLRW